MNNSKDGFGARLLNGFNSSRQPQRLVISSDATHEQNVRDEEKRTQYRRQYWQRYSKRIKRVFGSLTPNEYEAVSERAEAHGKKVFEQIWAESLAYCDGRILPTVELAEQQHILIQELRKIGNNINQLARLGHVQAKRGEGLVVVDVDDNIGVETLRQFRRLEHAITKFSDTSHAHLNDVTMRQDHSEGFSDDY